MVVKVVADTVPPDKLVAVVAVVAVAALPPMLSEEAVPVKPVPAPENDAAVIAPLIVTDGVNEMLTEPVAPDTAMLVPATAEVTPPLLIVTAPVPLDRLMPEPAETEVTPALLKVLPDRVKPVPAE